MKTRIYLLLIIMSILFNCLPVFALDFQVKLSESQILPQAPLGVTIEAVPDTVERALHSAYLMNTDIQVSLSHGDGAPVQGHAARPGTCDNEPSSFWTLLFAEETSLSRKYAINS